MSKAQGKFDFSVHHPFNHDLCFTGLDTGELLSKFITSEKPHIWSWWSGANVKMY